jgi:hypothetical protein
MWTSVTAIPSQRPLPISSIDENPASMDKKLLGSAAFKVKGRHIPRRHTGLLEPKKRWEKSAVQPDLLQLEINQAGSCDDSEAPYMPDFAEKLNHPTRFNLEAENLRRHSPQAGPATTRDSTGHVSIPGHPTVSVEYPVQLSYVGQCDHPSLVAAARVPDQWWPLSQ